jgi:hypothetical protein
MSSEHNYELRSGFGVFSIRVNIDYTYKPAEHGSAPHGSWHTPGDIDIHTVTVEEVLGYDGDGAFVYQMSREDIDVGWLWDLDSYATNRVLDEIDDWSCLADELVENA